MKKKVKTSPSAITHEEKKPVLERFWPTGVIASFAVAAAVGLHIAGYTTAPVKTEVAAEALALEAEEAEDAGADALIAPWEEAHPNGVPAEKEDALSVSEKEVATYISRSYRVPMAEAEQLTTWAVEIGAGFDVDPLLILAVAAVESSFNPKAKSGAGAEGLMQVMTRVHAEKFHAFGGPQAALAPYPSMVVGTSILSRLITRTGSVQKALKFYFGAANQPSGRKGLQGTKPHARCRRRRLRPCRAAFEKEAHRTGICSNPRRREAAGLQEVDGSDGDRRDEARPE